MMINLLEDNLITEYLHISLNDTSFSLIFPIYRHTKTEIKFSTLSSLKAVQAGIRVQGGNFRKNKQEYTFE